MLRRLFLLFPLLASGVTHLEAAELTVAVAANFMRPMQEIVTAFEAQTGHSVRVSYGSSGRLYAQVVNGAPYQVFFSADAEKPAALEASGHAVAGSRFTYAVGSLVLWSPDPAMNLEKGSALSNGSVKRIAVANPRLAPYGAAALQVLASLGVEKAFEGNLVMGENVTQAYQYVFTGNVAAGFVALSQVMEDGQIREGAGWVVPGELHDPIRQDAVMIEGAQANPAAVAFMEFMHGDAASNIMATFGYRPDI